MMDRTIKRWPLMAGVCLLGVGTAFAQPPAGAPPGGAPGGPPRAGGRGGGRGAPQYQTEKGKPIDNRPSSKTNDQPSWEGQTHAPYEPSGQGYTVTTVTDKLVAPWSIAFLPGGKMLVTEKPGNMRIVSADGTVSEPLTGVPKVHAQGQVGLLDVALDKNFAQNSRIFFTYSENVNNDMDSHIVLASATLNKDLSGITGAKIIFGSMPALSNQRYGANQGGRIAVDRDGNLFVMIGDRAPTPPSDYGQQNDTTIGKALHLTPEGKPVAGNPYIGKTGYAPEVYSMGHRSPEGLAINPANGDLWETEHGPQGGDELNKIEPGKNYGWPVVSHGIDYNNQPITTGTSSKAGMEEPRYYWNPVIAPSGLAFYQGNQFPGWKDSIFAGGLGAQVVERLHMDWKTNKVIGEEPLLVEPDVRARIRDVRFGPDGMMYVLTDSNAPATAKLFKITPKK